MADEGGFTRRSHSFDVGGAPVRCAESTNCYSKEIDMRPKKSASNSKKLAAGILMLFFALTLVASGQERTSVQPPDTSVNRQQSFHSESLFVRLSFWHPQSLGFLYQLPAVPSQSIFWTLPEKTDLVSPWKLELANQEEYQTMRTILGSIELGGVAYIGYQHIKKYGLK